MKTLPPDDPSNVDDKSSAGSAASSEAPPPEHSRLAPADPMVGVTVKDETGDKKAMSCGGACLADIASVLALS